MQSWGWNHVWTLFCGLFESNVCNIKDFTAIWSKSTPIIGKIFFTQSMNKNYNSAQPCGIVCLTFVSPRKWVGLWKGQFASSIFKNTTSALDRLLYSSRIGGNQHKCSFVYSLFMSWEFCRKAIFLIEKRG